MWLSWVGGSRNNLTGPYITFGHMLAPMIHISMPHGCEGNTKMIEKQQLTLEFRLFTDIERGKKSNSTETRIFPYSFSMKVFQPTILNPIFIFAVT